MRRHRTALVALFTAAVCSLAFAPHAGAQVWNEIGDAGDLISTAQLTVGAGPLITLNGTLSSPTDVDIYCIQVGPTPRVIGLPIASLQCVAHQGPNIWMFDASGVGAATNETCMAGVKGITTTLVSPPGPTNLYVAVSYYGVAPISPSGPIWLAAVAGERAPDGPGAAGALNGWAGTPVVQPLNPYQITFGFTAFCDAATPAAMPTWGSLKIRYGR